MLEMRGMYKAFGDVTVLDGVDFQVVSGEVHALLGANGAGKSTLIKVLGGLYPDAQGTTVLDGCAIDLATPKSALRSGIGIVHQEFDLVPEMSVAENIFLGFEGEAGLPGGLGGRMRRRALVSAARQLLARYRLGLDPAARVGDLTAGSQQIVEIARVLARQGDVMIFDEPTARLGHADRNRLFEVFATLRADGKKVVFVTHYLDEVMAIADRASVMRDGRMIATRGVAETSVEELSRLMVGGDVRRVRRRARGVRGTPVLAVQGLGDGGVLTGIDLAVAGGEIVGLVGHLGSGRHELTRAVLSGRPEAGRITVNGPPNRRGTIGFVPEHRRLEGIFADLPIASNIAVGFLRGRPMLAPLPRREVERTAAEAVARLQVKAAGTGQRIGELSGGNQQKVVFGRAMVSRPALYVIEAPTVGVDVKAAAELQSEIFALADRGAGVLLATDDLDEAILLSDRILVMLRGRIVAELNPEGLSHEALVAAMGAS